MSRMPRLHTKNGYHDAVITQVRYHDNENLFIDVTLCACGNETPGGPATLAFLSARNFEEIRRALEDARRVNAKKGYVDEIIGIERHKNRGFILDLQTAGGLWIDAKELRES